MQPRVREVLEGVHALLRGKRRWTKGKYVSAIGDDLLRPGNIPPEKQCYCLAGAIRCTIKPTPDGQLPSLFDADGSWELYCDSIKALGFDGEGNLTEWNDRKSRTLRQVLSRVEGVLANAA